MEVARGPWGVWSAVFDDKWLLTFLSIATVVLSVGTSRSRGDTGEWFASTWDYAKSRRA